MNHRYRWANRGRTTVRQQVVIRSCTDDPRMSTVHPQSLGALSTGCPRAEDSFWAARARTKTGSSRGESSKIVFAERLPSHQRCRRSSRAGPCPGVSEVAKAPPHLAQRSPDDGLASSERRLDVVSASSWRSVGGCPDRRLMSSLAASWPSSGRFSQRCRHWVSDYRAWCREALDTSSTGFSPTVYEACLFATVCRGYTRMYQCRMPDKAVARSALRRYSNDENAILER